MIYVVLSNLMGWQISIVLVVLLLFRMMAQLLHGGSAKAGNVSAVADQLTSGVVRIFSNQNAFAALKDDGSVVLWGANLPSTQIRDQLTSDIENIFVNNNSFAFLKKDGSIVGSNGNRAQPLGTSDSPVIDAVSTWWNTWYYLKADGSVVVDGPVHGGANEWGEIHGQVLLILSVQMVFAFLKADGTVTLEGEFSRYARLTWMPYLLVALLHARCSFVHSWMMASSTLNADSVLQCNAASWSDSYDQVERVYSILVLLLLSKDAQCYLWPSLRWAF